MSRHAVDPRDELNREIIAHSAGVLNCTLCGKCNRVCPHGIAPKTYVEILLSRLKGIGEPLEDYQPGDNG
jgi:succinate dehydrogenase/fumarate reductase-like Fe-S protein